MTARDFTSVTAQIERAIRESSFGARSGLPQAHLRLVQTQIEAIARGDLDTFLAQAHPDIVLEIFAPPEFPWICQARGTAEVREAVTRNFGSIDDQRPHLTSVFAEADTVILFGRERGVVRETGFVYDVEFVERFTFRDGRVAGVRIIAAHATPDRSA